MLSGAVNDFSFSVGFQEYWCKRLNPKDVCEKVYRQPPLRESLKKDKLKKQDLAITKPKANLLRFTDMIGKKIQYFCPGFLPNRRQVTWSSYLNILFFSCPCCIYLYIYIYPLYTLYYAYNCTPSLSWLNYHGYVPLIICVYSTVWQD